jgi:hypothetical protein
MRNINSNNAKTGGGTSIKLLVLGIEGLVQPQSDLFGGLSLTNYTVKKVIDFPVPSRDVTNQTLPGLALLAMVR